MPATALRRKVRTVRHRQHALLFLIVAVAIGGGGLLAAPAAAADDPGFEDATDTVTQSEVATIDVGVAAGEQATLTIESASSPFAVESTIADTDGDGTVQVRLDTAAVAPDAAEPLLTAADGGAVRNVTVENRPRAWALPADSYRLNVENETGTTGIATLLVEPQIALDGADGGLELNATADQKISGQAALEPGETLELRLQSTGSSAYLVTERATVRHDHSFAAFVDLGHVPGDSSFELYVRHNGSRKASAEGYVVATDTPDQEQRDANQSGPIELAYEGDRIELASAPNRTLRGTADLEAGTELSVRLRSTGGSPFLRTDRATVGDDGGFEASFNMSDIRPETEFTVVVRTMDDTDRSTRAPGVVIEPSESNDGSNMDIDDGSGSSPAALLGGVSGSIGGFIGIGAAAVLAIAGIAYMLRLDPQ
jgi:hypothetical protein